MPLYDCIHTLNEYHSNQSFTWNIYDGNPELIKTNPETIGHANKGIIDQTKSVCASNSPFTICFMSSLQFSYHLPNKSK
jgi:hypothetical protein